nr:sigma-54-dependent Fis family transcriptional regulator [Gemmatimonadota bacterium]
GDRGEAGGETEARTGRAAGVGLGFDVGMTLEDMEKRAIEHTLAGVRGNRRKAAGMLGIGERTLYRKLKQYGLA